MNKHITSLLAFPVDKGGWSNHDGGFKHGHFELCLFVFFLCGACVAIIRPLGLATFCRFELLDTLLVHLKLLGKSRAAQVGDGHEYGIRAQRGAVAVQHCINAVEADIN